MLCREQTSQDSECNVLCREAGGCLNYIHCAACHSIHSLSAHILYHTLSAAPDTSWHAFTTDMHILSDQISEYRMLKKPARHQRMKRMTVEPSRNNVIANPQNNEFYQRLKEIKIKDFVFKMHPWCTFLKLCFDRDIRGLAAYNSKCASLPVSHTPPNASHVCCTLASGTRPKRLPVSVRPLGILTIASSTNHNWPK